MSITVSQVYVIRDADILGGLPVFVGTRVPAKTLLDYLSEGHSLHDFLDDFPSVSRDQACGLLLMLEQLLVDAPYATAA
jgi:uncharacterized protein (DUF433 family)